MKKNKVIAFGLSTLMTIQAFPIMIFANNNSNNYEIYNNNKEELSQITNNLNLTSEEIQELKELDNYNNTIINERGVTSIITKIAKVAGNVIAKAVKMFGVKVAEKTVVELTDFLFGWQDDLQDGIEYFFINKCGWSKTAAHWTAKSIMFLVL